jgi:DeoR/GlpR family transcriptional regulator of sugar metabolism
MAKTTSELQADGPRERQLAIAEAVIKHGTISVERLAAMTGVSLMTVYRDLSQLEDKGVLQRHRGKVVAVASAMQEADAEFRLEQQAHLKNEIAAVAAEMIPSGSSLMMDDSTSGIWLLRALPESLPLTVVTNSLLVANEVSDRNSIKLVLAGGIYEPWARSLMGPTVTDYIRSMHADISVVSASGISGLGCFHPYQDNVAVKRAMLDSAERKLMLLDHSKLSRQALFQFATLDEFDAVIVDSATPKDDVARLRTAGVSVTVAPQIAEGTAADL